jgi:hypothetical protein
MVGSPSQGAQRNVQRPPSTRRDLHRCRDKPARIFRRRIDNAQLPRSVWVQPIKKRRVKVGDLHIGSGGFILADIDRQDFFARCLQDNDKVLSLGVFDVRIDPHLADAFGHSADPECPS